MRIAANRREGMALAAAMAAIVVIGALVAGAFFASTQEFRIGRNTIVQQRAFANAEYALNQMPVLYDATALAAFPNDSTRSRLVTNVNTGLASDSARLYVTKLEPYTFQVLVEGFAGNGQAQVTRRASEVIRIAMLQMTKQGALMTPGSVLIQGNARVSGYGQDLSSQGWDCTDVKNDSLAGVAVKDTSKVTVSGSGTLEGSPQKVQSKEAADSTTYTTFGDLTWTELVASADVKLTSFTSVKPTPATNADGTCNTKLETNWGDLTRSTPKTACADYFPTVYSSQSLSIQSGMGQGILLVDGDLDIQGNFQFFGVVIVRGEIAFTGTGKEGGKIVGVVMAASADLGSDENSLKGNTNVQYSNCAVTSALKQNARLLPVRERAWAEVF